MSIALPVTTVVLLTLDFLRGLGSAFKAKVLLKPPGRKSTSLAQLPTEGLTRIGCGARASRQRRRFIPDRERLAYSIDTVRGEPDYREVYPEPLPCVLATLRDRANGWLRRYLVVRRGIREGRLTTEAV